MIAVRKNLSKRPRSGGKLLLWDGIDERYRFSVFVTNLDLPDQMVLPRRKTIHFKNTKVQMLCIRSMDDKTFPPKHPKDRPCERKTCLVGWIIRYYMVSETTLQMF